jgi:hypothetical protein
MNLYEIFSSKKFLLKYSTNNQYIFFLLDIFNNIIQYQYNGNYHLIYAMVHKKEKFTQLINLTTLPVQQQQRSKQQPTTIKDMANNGLLRESVDDVVVDITSTTSTISTTTTTTTSSDNRFIPTEEWLLSWKSKLPIDVILR